MKRFTLEFQSLALEQKFQKHSQLENIPLLIKILKLFIAIIVVPCGIIAISNRRYVELIIFCIGGVSLPILNYAIKIYSNYYNIIINISVIVLISISAFKIYFYGSTIGEDDNFALFFFGSVMIQAQQIFHNVNSTFLPSATSVVVQTIMYLALTWNSYFYTYKYIYIVFNAFLVYFMYCQIKQKKVNYMLRQNEKQWIKIVKGGLSQQIITVKFDEKLNNLQLDIVNKNAMQKFKISNEIEFKEFSRKLRVFTQQQDYYYQGFQSKLISINNDLDLNGGQTLENQILSYIKQSIKGNESTYLENIKQQQKQPKNNQEKSVRLSIRNKQPTLQKGNKGSQYYTLIESALTPQKYDRYKIRLSYFQIQTSHRCCIIFDEESDQEKVKNLQEARKKQQTYFIKICIDLALKIQYITSNLLHYERSKQYLYLTLNKLQNVYDHHLMITYNNTKNKIIQFASISIAEIIDKIKESFWDQQLSIQFEFINCQQETIIQTNIKLLNQVMTNFIQNSLNSEIQEVINQACNLNQSKILQMYSPKKTQIPKKQIGQVNSPRRLLNILPKKVMTSSQIMSENNGPDQSTFNDLLDKIKDLKNSTILLRNKNQSSQLNQSIKVKFQIINGDNQQSNILKVTIKDKSGGMSQDSLLEIFKTINFNSAQESFEYGYFQNLGWKNNCNAIGKLGPYSDFFISPKYTVVIIKFDQTMVLINYLLKNQSQGVKAVFFLYTDMNIIDQSNSQYSFQNKIFFDNYNSLLENYYHKNQNFFNLKCKQAISQCLNDSKFKKNSMEEIDRNIQESLIENANVNEIYRFQFLDDKKVQSPMLSLTNRDNYLLKESIRQIEVIKGEGL